MTPRARALVVGLFFLAAFLHANLWGAIIPLWQIPDEAAHYEYVRLMVKLGRPPTPADADPELQAQMLRSMWENNYWEHLGFARPDQPPRRVLPGGWTSVDAIPDTAVIDDAYVYAFSQLQNSTPAYYAMLAPVQVAVVHLPIGDQLQVLRMVSRLIFALGVLFIVLTAGELFRWNLPLVIGAGLVCVLQPMFVYIGSGVNNDNGVMLFASAMIWQLAAGWRRGFSWPRLALIAVAAVLAILSKRTGVFLVAWVPLVLAVWLLTRVTRPVRWRILAGSAVGSVLAGVIIVVLYLMPAQTPVNWVSSTNHPTWSDQQARSGVRSFLLQRSSDAQPASLRLYAPLQIRIDSAGPDASLTWAAWVKGPVGGRAALRIEDNNGMATQAEFDATNDWTPVSVTHPLTRTTYRLSFTMLGLSSDPVYLDDLTVTTHNAPLSLVLPNRSAEEPRRLLAEAIGVAGRALGVGSHTERLMREYRDNLAVVSERIQPAIQMTIWTYWGRFGIFARAHNPMLPRDFYAPLTALMGLAVVSVLLQAVLRRAVDPATRWLSALFLLGAVILLAQTFMPLLVFATTRTWLPQGRYLFSGMALIVSVLAFGWIVPWPGRWKWLAVALVGAGSGLLTVAAAQACLQYFHG